MKKILVILGTRPEAIKLAPVIQALHRFPDHFETRVCLTAQHREMLDQVLSVFQIVPDQDLDLMTPNQSLSHLTARLFSALGDLLSHEKPDLVLVQGDTTSAMVAAMAAFYHRIRVAHVEAGLRTYQKYFPFPEEINRRIIDLTTDFYFTPTESNRKNLLREGIDPSHIFITGNTVIDALLWTRDFVRHHPPEIHHRLGPCLQGKRLILVTAHRRESFGEDLENICLALHEIAERHPEVVLVYPVHLNPNVREKALKVLSDHDRILLIDPLPYVDFVWLMDKAEIILTDSGGIQEEAPSLGKPVLVMRNHTERPEGIQAGNALLVGTDRQRIVHTVIRLLTHPRLVRKMAERRNPYGDGHAADRIVEVLLTHRESPPKP